MERRERLLDAGGQVERETRERASAWAMKVEKLLGSVLSSAWRETSRCAGLVRLGADSACRKPPASQASTSFTTK